MYNFTPEQLKERSRILAAIQARVKKQSLTEVSKSLNIPRQTLANVIIGVAHEGSVLQVMQAAIAARI